MGYEDSYLGHHTQKWTTSFLRMFYMQPENIMWRDSELKIILFAWQRTKIPNMEMDPLQRPVLLSYCCYVRQDNVLSHCTPFSRVEKKYIAEQRKNWKCPNRQDKAGYFWYETIKLCNLFVRNYTVLWLFNVFCDMSL